MRAPSSSPSPSAVVLLSGGLDSAVCLALARREGRVCHAISVDYGQRHRHELAAAADIAASLGAASHAIVAMDLRAIGGSALTSDIAVPHDRDETAMGADIPVTYVPARNMTFLSLAMGLAEARGAGEVWIGVNAVDYSGYPDCRPEFIRAFSEAARLGTKRGVQGDTISIRTPLAERAKADIIRLGADLGVDFSRTHSCYDPDERGLACGRCDSCALRRRGFELAGVPDPTRYTAHSGAHGAAR